MEKCVLRISALDDRTMEEYEAETEFVHYLAKNGASVADVIPSRSGKLVEFMQVKPSVIGLSEAADGAEGDAECFAMVFRQKN